ncbi:hypothetical protein SAMN05443667_10271 [Flavobacterium gillisiae]|uniref:Alpha-ketoglutarate decarboxylase n=1 Tax=Flavobacterium gillisiae TaxID=150146 RepID=A0A1H3YQI5_9FLAO|nr:hypothetical protein [Flavobacterium gillisiae]SEA13282.1 hypothetical protein SAMN05443667_10271 [Flavobacterium gillisiae]
MRKNNYMTVSKQVLIVIIALISNVLSAQHQTITSKSSSDFWKNVQFGGGIGLGFGSGYTNISLAPSAIYNFNEYVALGLGAQYTYAKQQNYYASHLYGGSIIGLFNPLPQVQLSAELEELRVNINLDGSNSNSQDYWNTGLFLGAGYRSGNVTMGARYNVLNDNNNIYGSAFMPFVRVYF